MLRSEKSPSTDINLPNYNIDYMPTKANRGGVFLYILNKLNYKAKNNLQINIDKKPASILLKYYQNHKRIWLLVAFINIQILQLHNLMNVIYRSFLTNYLLKTKMLY